jgi:hypothetical protein
MFKKIFNYRIELYFLSLLLILFGSIIFPIELFEDVILPILSLANIITGILLIYKKRLIFRVFILLFSIALISTFFEIYLNPSFAIGYLKFATYFLFYIIVTYEIILKVWKSKKINRNVIIGLMSGYISLGFVALFLFMSIELANPHSFSGLTETTDLIRLQIDELFYFSYITLMTIGYGDIVPITPIAQKAAILIGLLGQFYLVILTGIIVGKFINQQKKTSE